jgi:hypothetical protein
MLKVPRVSVSPSAVLWSASRADTVSLCAPLSLRVGRKIVKPLTLPSWVTTYALEPLRRTAG